MSDLAFHQQQNPIWRGHPARDSFLYSGDRLRYSGLRLLRVGDTPNYAYRDCLVDHAGRRGHVHHRSDTVLNRLICGAIRTGLFAGIFNMGDLICFLVFPSTNLYGMFSIPVGRIYTNTLMDGLLARKSLNAELSPPYDVSEALGAIDWGTNESSQTTSKAQPTSNQHQVEVQRTVD
ncbi:hypothetical protein J3R83DRAFT_9165 [Lanmaoa asiatica]|nr:hypothetical protein J3R83DRAFT_9165 [Lanmaoa asiatica]